jgi:hypothetical protein
LGITSERTGGADVEPRSLRDDSLRARRVLRAGASSRRAALRTLRMGPGASGGNAGVASPFTLADPLPLLPGALASAPRLSTAVAVMLLAKPVAGETKVEAGATASSLAVIAAAARGGFALGETMT